MGYARLLGFLGENKDLHKFQDKETEAITIFYSRTNTIVCELERDEAVHGFSRRHEEIILEKLILLRLFL
jgi:hypothetical protein